MNQIVCNYPVATGCSHESLLSKHAQSSCDKIAFLPDTNISEHLTCCLVWLLIKKFLKKKNAHFSFTNINFATIATNLGK